MVSIENSLNEPGWGAPAPARVIGAGAILFFK